MQLLASDGWREWLREVVLPFGFGSLSIADLGDDVLEVGPGPGLTTDLLRVELDRLTAVEVDAGLADALRGRLVGRNVEVVQADATALPFDDARFSGAVSFTMFHHVPTAPLQDLLMAEVARVLQPGGVFVANDSVASDDLAALHDGDVYNPIDPTTLEARLRVAGFAGIEVRANEYAWAVTATRG